jgi:hypothetical protein
MIIPIIPDRAIEQEFADSIDCRWMGQENRPCSSDHLKTSRKAVKSRPLMISLSASKLTESSLFSQHQTQCRIPHFDQN